MEKEKAFISIGHYPKRPGAMNTKYGLVEHHEAKKIVDALFRKVINYTDSIGDHQSLIEKVVVCACSLWVVTKHLSVANRRTPALPLSQQKVIYTQQAHKL